MLVSYIAYVESKGGIRIWVRSTCVLMMYVEAPHTQTPGKMWYSLCSAAG
jgi:hypothetical protein